MSRLNGNRGQRDGCSLWAEGLPTKFFGQLQRITSTRKVGARHDELGAAHLLGSADDILEIVRVSLDAAVFAPIDGVG